jgi:hypothetical protein
VKIQVPYSAGITILLHFIALIAWAPSATLFAQSFQPEVKGLGSRTSNNPDVKGLSGNSSQPSVQGLNNNTQPNVQGLSSSQSSQQGSSGTSSTSSSGTSSATGTGTTTSSTGSEGMKSGGSTGTSSSSRPDKFFTCSRCGIEGAQAQGYCLGNFGMLTNTNGEPFKHVRK